jgi:nicotinate-nucleotide adenylyltransferase
MKKEKIGLFFGSFNPIHIGHLIIANFMATQTDLNKVWLVLSPQNPLKPKNTLANDYERLHLLKLAIKDNDLLQVSDIEFSLPKPSYTIDTLTYLQEKYPTKEFVLIMGGDNLATLHKWKNYEQILLQYGIYVYKRPNYAVEAFENHEKVKFFSAPMLDISATYIRACIQNGHSIKYLVADAVLEELEKTTLYRN